MKEINSTMKKIGTLQKIFSFGSNCTLFLKVMLFLEIFYIEEGSIQIFVAIAINDNVNFFRWYNW